MTGFFRHYKGAFYYMTGTAQHTETGEQLTIYKDAAGNSWARPTAMFFETIEHEGAFVARFAPAPNFVPQAGEKYV